MVARSTFHKLYEVRTLYIHMKLYIACAAPTAPGDESDRRRRGASRCAAQSPRTVQSWGPYIHVLGDHGKGGGEGEGLVGRTEQILRVEGGGNTSLHESFTLFALTARSDCACSCTGLKAH